MLKPIHDLPEGIAGVMARGTVTRHDYRAVLRPMLQDAASTGKPLNLLYAFGQDFDGFTPAAAWEDVNLAFDHLSDVEHCAIVTDRTWVKAASHFAGMLTPARVRTFERDDWDGAVEWLRSQEPASASG